MYFPLFMILGFAILGSIAWFAFRAIAGAIRPPMSRSGHPECARCGYNVRGLLNWTCPECGGDLLEWGILGWHRTEKKADVLGNAIVGLLFFALIVWGMSAAILSEFGFPNWPGFVIAIWTFAGGVSAMLYARRRVRARWLERMRMQVRNEQHPDRSSVSGASGP